MQQQCDNCGKVDNLIHVSFRHKGKEFADFICAECYQHEYDEAIAQLGDYEQEADSQ